MSWKAASSSPAFLSPWRMGNQARHGEAVREGWHTQRPMNSSAPWRCKIHGHSVQRTIFLSVAEAEDTYVCVRVVELHHNVGRRSHCHLWVAKNLHLVEDERLIPGGIEGVTHSHGFLRLVEERDNGVGVWRETAPSVSLRHTTDFKHYVCRCTSVWANTNGHFTADTGFSNCLQFAVTAVNVGVFTEQNWLWKLHR